MPTGAQYRLIARLARRGIPIAIEAYRRWQQLTPEQRERYVALARQYGNRAGGVAQRAGGVARQIGDRRRSRRSG